MSLLPEIEDGQLQEDSTPQLYTPPRQAQRIDFQADGWKKDKKVQRDAPKMEDIHECEPNEYMRCIRCGRKMLI